MTWWWVMPLVWMMEEYTRNIIDFAESWEVVAKKILFWFKVITLLCCFWKRLCDLELDFS